MSRFDGDYEEGYPGQGALWEANLRRALSGKRGQQALADLEEALLALPERKLISGQLADDNGMVCTVGAYALHVRTKAGEPRKAVLRELQEAIPVLCETCWWPEVAHREGGRGCDQFVPGSTEGGGDYETWEVGKRAGLVGCVAWHLGQLNDDHFYFGGLSDEARYSAVLEYVRRAQRKPVPA